MNVCILIGFSYRDSHINEVFKEFANRGSKDKRRKIIVVSPSAIQDFFVNFIGNGNQPEVDNLIYDTTFEKAGLRIINKSIDMASIEEIVNDIDNSLKSIDNN